MNFIENTDRSCFLYTDKLFQIQSPFGLYSTLDKNLEVYYLNKCLSIRFKKKLYFKLTFNLKPVFLPELWQSPSRVLPFSLCLHQLLQDLIHLNTHSKTSEKHLDVMFVVKKQCEIPLPPPLLQTHYESRIFFFILSSPLPKENKVHT